MYTGFYGFSEKPFHVTPDPRFLFLTPSHQEALASMIYGINEKKGFISITGEVGTGKTTLIYSLLNNISETVKTVLIFHTNITFDQLLKNVLLELNLPIMDESKIALLRQLNEYLIALLSRDEILTIIIDEAQNLPAEVMEELRMLSNLETSTSKLLQIVLVGQPELEAKLNSDNLRQLKQRIGIRRSIAPLSDEEAKQYIEHRLHLVGSAAEKIFTQEAISLIIRYARGIPRTINIVCDNAFLIGYGASKKKIDAHILHEVIRDMDGSASEKPQPLPVAARRTVQKPAMNMTTLQQMFTGTFVLLPNILKGTMIVLPIITFMVLGLLAFLGLGFLQKSLSSFAADAQDKFPTLRQISLADHKPTVPDVFQTDDLPPIASDTDREDARRFQTVSVNPGDCMLDLARKHYHSNSPTFIDFIQEANPAIEDINAIAIKQKIRLPEITEESLLIKSPDSSYKIHLGTFSNADSVRPYSNEPALAGKKIDIIPRKVSPNKTWYRVVAGDFGSKEECRKAISIMKGKGLLPAL